MHHSHYGKHDIHAEVAEALQLASDLKHQSSKIHKDRQLLSSETKKSVEAIREARSKSKESAFDAIATADRALDSVKLELNEKLDIED